MTSHSDVLAFSAAATPDKPAGIGGPDLDDLYRIVLRQLSENVEHLVAHAFATHAAARNMPVPPAVSAALSAAASPGPAEFEPAPSTGNAGLDFLNERLHQSAAGFAQPSAVPTPPWLHPFTLPENVRFTRTPDPVLRWERSGPSAEELAIAAREAARLAAEQAARSAEEERERDRARASVTEPAIPVWRRPFNLPPNVRYTRSPNPARSLAAIPADLDPPAGAVDIARAAAVVEAGPAAPAPIGPNATRLSLSASIAQRHTSTAPLPGWFALATPTIESRPPVGPGVPQPSAAMPPDSSMFEDADSDGSAALDRTALLPDLSREPAEDAAFPSRGDEGSPDASIGESASASGSGAALSPAPAERRAFGSHGLPAFEAAVHFDGDPDSYEYPPVDLLAPPQKQDGLTITREGLEQNARLLEGVLEDFGIRGEIIAVRPGPVVTLYEFEPAPGVKSSRVMNLADDIARSMSAISARVAVVQGRNVIGIELPNERRETVFLRELIGSDEFDGSDHRLAIALGKTIGGESVIVDLARMPHLLVAGTTGSGKSVAINTMILSLLYRLRPEECRLIMVDPKMLELSIYDGIPHLLTPVVTDSKKAVIALKWAVREMEDRYKKMAKVGVRNIDGFNARVLEAQEKGEVITRTIQQGFDRETGEPVFETEEMDLSTMPYIVIIVDEMADLMMVAGKEIEGAIQRLAQMARAAGIHLIMATQRPSVDVITGTIKANFPTRISFQVTSKIDSRTILGEQGAEQLLGQGDMLHMAGGGRIARVHGPFVSDGEVEKVVWHLKAQGHPEYLDVITAEDDPVGSRDAGVGRDAAEDDEPQDGAVFDRGNFGDENADLYEQGVKIVLRDKKCSTSYIQRRLQVGYNKAASIVERMEKEGLVGPANGTGKREILNFSRDHSRVIFMPGNDD